MCWTNDKACKNHWNKIKTEATKPKKTDLELKTFEPDTLLHDHLLLNVNGAKFEMKTVKMGSEKSSYHTNVLHIKDDLAHAIFSLTSFYDLYRFIFSLQIYFEYGSIYSGGSWKKMSNKFIYDTGLWRCTVVMGNIFII